MSLYDKASLIFSGAAGAGNEEVAYNIKPVEKLKVDEYIKNGGFDTDSDWTKSGESASDVTMTISGGRARIQTEGSAASFNQYNVFEEGKTYKISLELEVIEGSVKIDTLGKQITSDLGTGKHSLYFTPEAGQHEIRIVRGEPGEDNDFYIDNVSVREVEQKANDFSFVRASDLTATYEGADGLIKKTRENLLTYSNDFDNAIWAGSSTWTSGQSGYDGSTNAWSFNKYAHDHSDYYNQFFHGLHTFSIYAKKQSSAGLAIYAFHDWNGSSFDGNKRVVYDLSDGTLVYQSAIVSTTSEAIGSNWWRISMTVEQDDMRWYLYTTDGTQTLVDNVTVTLQDAQLEQGLVATPYIHRTDSYSKSTAGIQEDEPRYDYSLDNDAPPALLYEPERINLVDYSEAFLGDDWIKSSNYTVANNAATSPEGVDNAVKCTIPNVNGQLRFRSAVDANTDYVWSFYVKRGTATQLKYSVYDNTNAANIVAQTSYYSDTSSSEWKRIEVPFTTPAGCSSVGVYPDRDSQGNGTVFFWGFQLEKGSCVSSYIPTYGSAGTRYKETIPQYTPSKTNLDKYTFFAHSHSDRVAADNRAPRLIGDGNSSIMGIFVNASGKKQFFLRDNENNSVLSKHTFDSFTADDDTKYAFVVDNIALEAKLFIDGVLRETMSLTERVDAKIVSVSGSDGNPDRIKSIMYFPEALEDGDVVSLTTIS